MWHAAPAQATTTTLATSAWLQTTLATRGMARHGLAVHAGPQDLARAREAEVADTQRVAHQLAAATAGYEEEKKKQADMT